MHDQLQVEFGDGRAGTAWAAGVVADVALASFEREVRCLDEVDELVGRHVAGPVGKHRITLELVHRERCTERVSHAPDEISQHVVRVLELHRLEVAGVAANVGDQQIAPFDPCHSRPLAPTGLTAAPAVRSPSDADVGPLADDDEDGGVDHHQRSMWNRMISQTDAYEAGRLDLGTLVSDLRGFLIEADPHDPTVRDHFELFWAPIDAQLELRD